MTIIPREQWGARYGRGERDPGPEPRVVIHHSHRPALTPGATLGEEAAAVRGIEEFHVRSNGWAGIGYNFLVAPSGRVFEGRGWEHKGAHAGPVNGSSIGICLLIDGNQVGPNDALIRAVRSLIARGIALGEISERYTLSGHRDHMEGRTCPGERVYARLQELRHDAVTWMPEVTPSVTGGVPTPAPLELERIEIPTVRHVSEIVRVRGLAAGAVAPGLQVAEVLLRAMVRGQPVGRRDVVKAAADAVADWIKSTREE